VFFTIRRLAERIFLLRNSTFMKYSPVMGVDMIITMLPFLANGIHDADASLHDNTYKRVFGNWKEWEVVIWDKRLNTSKSLTILEA
jgi:hypothetical protein